MPVQLWLLAKLYQNVIHGDEQEEYINFPSFPA
jgi:hypothetical protein